MKVGRKLVNYALLYKKLIIAALLMLTVSVGAELAGPFIAKKMIDDHILGIESTWYETNKGKDAVSYKGNWYKREQYLTSGEEKGEEMRILQVGRDFYFIPSHISFDGERTITSGKLTITKGDNLQPIQLKS